MKISVVNASWIPRGWNRYIFPIFIVFGVRFTLGVLLAMIWLILDRYRPTAEYMISQGYLVFPEQASLWGRMFLDVWLRWDAINFLHIAYEGYSVDYYLAFYPLFPLLTRVLTQVLFLGVVTPARLGLMGMLVSTVSFAIAMIALQEWIVQVYNDIRLARMAILLWAITPTAIFLFAPFSDALFICLTTCFFLALSRKRWLIAGLLSMFAGLARVQGIFLMAPLIFLLFRDIYRREWSDFVKKLPLVALTPLGWGGYFLWSQRRNSLIRNYSEYWTTTLRDPITSFVHTLKLGLSSHDWLIFFEITTVIFFGLMMALMFRQGLQRKSPELVIYALVSYAVFVSLYRTDASSYISLPRYVLSLFPAFIVLADLLLRKPALVRKLYIVASFTAMLIIACLYALWVFIA